MGAIGLHHSVNPIDSLEEKREHRHAILLREQGIGRIELFDVIRAVVWRQRDSCERDLGAAGLECGNNFVEIGARVLDRKTAKAVVASEFDDDDIGPESKNGVQSPNSILGGVAANALVDDAVMIAARVESGLEVVGIALAGIRSIAGGEAIAEAHQDGAVVWFYCRG